MFVRRDCLHRSPTTWVHLRVGEPAGAHHIHLGYYRHSKHHYVDVHQSSPISFGASTTISAASMFIYDKTAPTNPNTTDANSWAVAIIDFGGTVSSTAGAFTYTVAASPNGLAYWTAS